MRIFLIVAVVLSVAAAPNTSFATNGAGTVQALVASNGLGQDIPLTFVNITGVSSSCKTGRFVTTNKNIIALLTAAYLAGKEIYVAGTGACNAQTPDSELISYVQVPYP